MRDKDKFTLTILSIVKATKKHVDLSSRNTSNRPIRGSYVTNPTPYYQPSKIDKKNPPAIVKSLVNAAKTNNPARHEAWYTTPRIDLKTGTRRPFLRRMNEHRARAINALMVALADRMNIVSGKIEASVEQLSDWCGLSTGRDPNKNISRASRALLTLEELGAIKCERVWDDTTHSYIPKIIWVTELFFVLINYEQGKFLSAQNQQLAWENQALREKGERPITLSEARRRARERHIKIAFEYRTKKMAFKKQRRYAQKLMRMEREQAKTEILRDLIKMYTQDELEAMGHQGLRRKVSHRYYVLRKLAKATTHPYLESK